MIDPEEWRSLVERVARATRVTLEDEDRIQEGWVACLEAIPLFDRMETPNGILESFVAQRIRWRIIDAARPSRSRYKLTFVHGIDADWLAAPDRTDAIIDTLWVEQAFAALDDEERRAFTWRFVDCMTWAEIGERVGVSGSGARKRYWPVLGKLGADLKE